MGAPLKANHKLLDFLIKSRNMENDAQLARVLEIAPARLSKIRHKIHRVSADFILLVHDKLGLSVAEIRALID
jgi:plasmid maintenance system antidote protein VapI